MKEIKMDYQTYQEELERKSRDGFCKGYDSCEERILNYLQGDEKLCVFVWSWEEEKIEKGSFWEKLATALGREDEIELPKWEDE